MLLSFNKSIPDLHPDRFFDLLLGPHKGQIFEKKKSLKTFSSETVCFMKLTLCIHVPGISLYKKLFFVPVR